MRTLRLPTLPMIALVSCLAGTSVTAPAKGVATRHRAAAPASDMAQVAGSAAPVLQVNTSRGRMVMLPRPISDLFIADDSIADVQVRSPTQLYIFGKKAGETTISATAKGGAVVYAATVRVANNLDSIGQMLGLAMPEAKIVATPMNGLILLTGTVAAPQDAAEAERLVQAFVGDSAKVLSRLKTATPLQVNLQVRIAEVSRSFVKNMSANIASLDQTGGFKFGLTRGRAAAGSTQYSPNGAVFNGFSTGSPGATVVTQGNGTTLAAAGRLLGLDLLGSLDLGETIGQVSTLATPNLTALSGETANFLAGGEIPIPISQGLGAVSVEYKSYGISLSYTPTVLADGRISLRVRPEVSQLSAQGAVQINGTNIPALTTRRAETTLELGSGQSMVIGGLLSNDNQNSIEKTPGLGDVPVLGALFRSNGFRRNETELMIVITPYLVKPVNNSADIALPTDGYKSPTDAQRFLLGEIGSGTTGGKRPVPTMATMATPNAAPPTVGAVAPLPTGPLAPIPATGRAVPDDKAASRPRKPNAPMPGFSN